MQNDLFRGSGKERVSSPDQLNRYIKIVTPGAAIVLIGLAAVLVGSLIWGFMGSVPVTLNLAGAVVLSEDDTPCKLYCVADIEAGADSLREGMEAQVSLNAAPRDAYGFIYGKVESVSAYPITEQKLAERVGNEELADYLMGTMAGKLVVIALERDGGAPNGLKWSHPSGAALTLSNGALASVTVIVKEQRPIDLILDGEET